MTAHCQICGRIMGKSRKPGRQANVCSDTCKAKRKRKWQYTKMHTDRDYKLNQQAAQKKWQEAHGDYWKDYRSGHPNYTKRNRDMQRQRNANRFRCCQQTAENQPVIAKMDEINPLSHTAPAIAPGRYRLQPLNPGIAKMDELIVQILFVTDS